MYLNLSVRKLFNKHQPTWYMRRSAVWCHTSLWQRYAKLQIIYGTCVKYLWTQQSQLQVVISMATCRCTPDRAYRYTMATSWLPCSDSSVVKNLRALAMMSISFVGHFCMNDSHIIIGWWLFYFYLLTCTHSLTYLLTYLLAYLLTY